MALLYDFTDSGSFTAAGLGPFLVDGGTRIAEETFGDKGYSGYRVSPTVQRHEAQGAGRPFWWGARPAFGPGGEDTGCGLGNRRRVGLPKCCQILAGMVKRLGQQSDDTGKSEDFQS